MTIKARQPELTPAHLCHQIIGRKPFNEPEWLFELKHDGYRAFVRPGEFASNFFSNATGSCQANQYTSFAYNASTDSLRIQWSCAIDPYVHGLFQTPVNPLEVIEAPVFSDGGSTKFAVQYDLSFVPEPATLALLGMGLSGLALTRRRRTH